MGSLSDQLLKAGLISEQQLKKADTSDRTKSKQKLKTPDRQMNSRRAKRAPSRNGQANKTVSDLEAFYRKREQLEKKEQQEALRKKQEEARRKKELNRKTNQLISDNLLNQGEADIRYNFVVGSTIKYLFVTPEQQEKLAQGQLAITFMGGKRCLIPAEIGHQILALNPNKIVILNQRDE